MAFLRKLLQHRACGGYFSKETPRRRGAAPTGADENGGLDGFVKIKIDPQRNMRPVVSWCFLKSPRRKLVRARLLEPATVVSASADEHA